MIDSKKLSDLVCDTEKKFNKSRKRIAEEIGISRDMLYKLMATDRNPSAENLQKIANYFHVSTDYLLKTDDEDPHAIDIKNFGNNNTIITGHHNTTEVNSTQRSGATNPPVFSATTPEEAELLQLYRSLTPAQRSAFLTLAKTLK